MKTPSISLILCSVPDADTGRKIASLLLDQKLVACVSILPGMESHYEWEGKREHSQEALLLIKSLSEKFGDISQSIRSIHPYECPEIIQLESVATFEKYATWIKQSVL